MDPNPELVNICTVDVVLTYHLRHIQFSNLIVCRGEYSNRRGPLFFIPSSLGLASPPPNLGFPLPSLPHTLTYLCGRWGRRGPKPYDSRKGWYSSLTLYQLSNGSKSDRSSNTFKGSEIVFSITIVLSRVENKDIEMVFNISSYLEGEQILRRQEMQQLMEKLDSQYISQSGQDIMYRNKTNGNYLPPPHEKCTLRTFRICRIYYSSAISD
jgi:hypothetical protein